jgi:hypothetical protein
MKRLFIYINLHIMYKSRKLYKLNIFFLIFSNFYLIEYLSFMNMHYSHKIENLQVMQLFVIQLYQILELFVSLQESKLAVYQKTKE